MSARFVAVMLYGSTVAFAACRRETTSVTSNLIEEAAPPPPPAERSRFSVPLAYDFSAVAGIVERVVPPSFGSMDSVHQVGDDTRRHYAFEADRSPFIAFAEGRLLHLRATLAYTARGFYKPIVGPTIGAGCGGGENRPRIVVELATPLTLTNDWHLASKARLVRVEPASTLSRDHCDVSILHRDVTDRVVEAARNGIASHLGDIDRKVGDVNLQSRFTQWWSLLNRPIRLTEGVWLLLGPEQLGMGRPSGRGHVLTVPVTLDAHPQIVTSAEEPHVDTPPLPPLGHDTTANGFHINMDGIVDYSTATLAVGLALTNKSVTQGGRTVRLESLRVTPASKGRLALTVNFTGDARGTLRFLGTPTYDAKHRQIFVPDLDYDLDTDSQLINTYSWLRSDVLRATFRDQAHVPVTEALETGKKLLLNGLNRKIGDALTLSATVDSVAVKGLFVTRAGIIVRAEALGQAAVAVKQK
ncbi:MAG TPA: DUF4403 family protein [Gemmatimonadaceae bacterium]|jgi:hypothetical protein|nr:DUF4403 family protein [Gemmatimonadaceae bacterium]